MERDKGRAQRVTLIVQGYRSRRKGFYLAFEGQVRRSGTAALQTVITTCVLAA